MYIERILGDTPLMYLTVDQFLELRESGKAGKVVDSQPTKKRYLYGYNSIGLELLGGASKATVYRLLKSGRISPSITKSGKIVFCDFKMEMKLFQKPQGGRK